MRFCFSLQFVIRVKNMSRPKGSGGGQQIIHKLRTSIYDAISTLEKRGKPLGLLLADAFEANPTATLLAISRVLPRDINIQAESTNYINVLEDVSRSIQSKTIDHSPAPEDRLSVN